MAEFENEKRAHIDQPRIEGVSPEPFLHSSGKGQGEGRASATPTSPVQKTPQETLKRWNALVREIKISPPATREKVNNLIKILQTSKNGIRLIDDLHEVLTRKGGLASRLIIDFRAQKDIIGSVEEEGDHKNDRAGFFSPGYRYARLYTVYIGWDDHALNKYDDSSYVSGVNTTIKTSTAMMVKTLHHELLHVWFIHKFLNIGGDDQPFTGHTTLDFKGRYSDIHPDFERRVVAMIRELEVLEKYSLGKSGKR